MVSENRIPSEKSERVEEVRRAVEDSGRSYVKASYLRDAVDMGQTRVGYALLALEREGYLELYRENEGPNLFRVVGGDD